MKYIIFNWKSYLNLKQSEYLSNNISKIKKNKNYKIISAPNNFFHLSLSKKFKSNIFAAQNFDLDGRGASTGSLDISHLIENKIKYTLIGHSEMRSNHGETDKIVHKKFELSIESKLTPIVCVGESLKVYKSKKTNNFLSGQIKAIFKKSQKYDNIILAYEPLWAIGTGLTPDLSEINDICKYLSNVLKKYSFKKINILYGGSVNLSNISDILNLQFIDGVLVGSASTKPSFINYFK
jgi:triosephosphate isomerase